MFPFRFEVKAAAWSASVTALCIVAVSFLGATALGRRAALAQSEPSVDRTFDPRSAVARPAFLACQNNQQALTIATAVAVSAAAAVFAVSAQFQPDGRGGQHAPTPSRKSRIRPAANIRQAQRRRRATGGNHPL